MKRKKPLPSASIKAFIIMHVGMTKDLRPRLEDRLYRPKTVTAPKKDTIRPTITGSSIMNRGTRHNHDFGDEDFEVPAKKNIRSKGRRPFPLIKPSERDPRHLG